MSLANERSTVLACKATVRHNSTKMYIVQNYFILCAEKVNECVYTYTPRAHFYVRDQLTVQYNLFGATVALSRKMEVSRTV